MRSLLLAVALLVVAQQPVSYHQLGHAVLKDLIETNTTPANGNTTTAADKLATRFRAAGFPDADIQVIGPQDRDKNFIVRYRGRAGATLKPILLLAHLDVVEAKREDWTVDPFVLTEKDGYFYGRGTQDVKGGGATLATALLRLKSEGWIPNRDVILALTAGEEGGEGETYNGVQWLLANHRDLIDAEYSINVDAGGGEMENGKHTIFDVQAAEKVYHSVSLTAKNPGGHSSLPRPDNAIYSLSRALDRISRYQFPAQPNDIVRAYFAKAALAAPPGLAANMKRVAEGKADAATYARLSKTPLYNAQLRTTCVATELSGGHAENALPQTARAVVNCRMLPDDDAKAVERQLTKIIADTNVHLAPIDTAKPSPPSPLRADLFDAISATVKDQWGAMPIVPMMETGATDGLYLRNAGIPVYGFSGIFIDINDVRAHGKDERILVSAFDDALDFTYALLKRLTS